jgi:hypothetical protein
MREATWRHERGKREREASCREERGSSAGQVIKWKEKEGQQQQSSRQERTREVLARGASINISESKERGNSNRAAREKQERNKR